MADTKYKEQMLIEIKRYSGEKKDKKKDEKKSNETE